MSGYTHSSMYTMVYTAVSHMVLNDLLNGCPIYIKKADCFGTRVPWNGSEARIHTAVLLVYRSKKVSWNRSPRGTFYTYIAKVG